MTARAGRPLASGAETSRGVPSCRGWFTAATARSSPTPRCTCWSASRQPGYGGDWATLTAEALGRATADDASPCSSSASRRSTWRCRALDQRGGGLARRSVPCRTGATTCCWGSPTSRASCACACRSRSCSGRRVPMFVSHVRRAGWSSSSSHGPEWAVPVDQALAIHRLAETDVESAAVDRVALVAGVPARDVPVARPPRRPARRRVGARCHRAEAGVSPDLSKFSLWDLFVARSRRTRRRSTRAARARGTPGRSRSHQGADARRALDQGRRARRPARAGGRDRARDGGPVRRRADRRAAARPRRPSAPARRRRHAVAASRPRRKPIAQAVVSGAQADAKRLVEAFAAAARAACGGRGRTAAGRDARRTRRADSACGPRARCLRPPLPSTAQLRRSPAGFAAGGGCPGDSG